MGLGVGTEGGKCGVAYPRAIGGNADIA